MSLNVIIKRLGILYTPFYIPPTKIETLTQNIISSWDDGKAEHRNILVANMRSHRK